VLETPEDTEKARSWMAKFKDVSIPRNSVELQFARSSGPGGQVTKKKEANLLRRC
jgi:peptidyl-tRNA hydrolase ICT1